MRRVMMMAVASIPLLGSPSTAQDLPPGAVIKDILPWDGGELLALDLRDPTDPTVQAGILLVCYAGPNGKKFYPRIAATTNTSGVVELTDLFLLPLADGRTCPAVAGLVDGVPAVFAPAAVNIGTYEELLPYRLGDFGLGRPGSDLFGYNEVLRRGPNREVFWIRAHMVVGDDANGDGDTDGRDFLIWQRNLGVQESTVMVDVFKVICDGSVFPVGFALDGDGDLLVVGPHVRPGTHHLIILVRPTFSF